MKVICFMVIAFALVCGGMRAYSENAAAKKHEGEYPLETCVVSGDRLDAMGDPYAFNYKGADVWFCCEDCKHDFLKKPEKYLAKLEKAKKMKAGDHKAHGGHGSKVKPDSGHGSHVKDSGGHHHGGHDH